MAGYRALRWTCLLGASLCAVAASGGESNVPHPVLVKGKGDACVAPVEVMRRDHMKFLLDHRDETVHHGDRAPRFSLAGCVDCHSVPDPAGAFVPVDAPDQFCASCHAFASVKLDCFECHSTVPAGETATHHARGDRSWFDRLSQVLFGGGGGGQGR